ncbi:FadR/GntR family transcriptional regulator, partial [Corynebacterium casei]
MTQPNSAGSQANSFAPLPPLNRTESAIQAIKSYIVNHNLKPGDPLPSEHQLCQELQVSRSAVREAVGQLQALDIVRVERGKGSFVGDMS